MPISQCCTDELHSPPWKYEKEEIELDVHKQSKNSSTTWKKNENMEKARLLFCREEVMGEGDCQVEKINGAQEDFRNV